MTLSEERLEILRLRARVVVLEQSIFAALELALRIRPEELDQSIERSRIMLERSYRETDFASDVRSGAERLFLAAEVERLMRGLQADLGFPGGVPVSDAG